jgi:hypothetical protein
MARLWTEDLKLIKDGWTNWEPKIQLIMVCLWLTWIADSSDMPSPITHILCRITLHCTWCSHILYINSLSPWAVGWLGVLLAFSTAEPARPITDHRLAFSMAEPARTDLQARADCVRMWPLDAEKSDEKTGRGRKMTMDAEKNDEKKIRRP